MSEQIPRAVERLMCEADWDVSVWLSTGNYISGNVDPADRRALIDKICALTLGQLATVTKVGRP